MLVGAFCVRNLKVCIIKISQAQLNRRMGDAGFSLGLRIGKPVKSHILSAWWLWATPSPEETRELKGVGGRGTSGRPLPMRGVRFLLVLATGRTSPPHGREGADQLAPPPPLPQSSASRTRVVGRISDGHHTGGLTDGAAPSFLWKENS